jgi:hypothetical protein
MSDLSGLDNLLPDEAIIHYEDGREAERLSFVGVWGSYKTYTYPIREV